MDKIIILGHENPDVDSIVSGYLLEKILKKKGYNVEFVIPDMVIADETRDICRRYGLEPSKFMRKIDLKEKDGKYILVDHYERDLGGEIVCIIDHHPASKEIMIKNYYNNEDISSTALYICLDNENLLDEFDLKLVVVATLVDTASFHSTKGRYIDKEWVINICNKYNFNYDELDKEGLCLTSLDDIEKVSFNGLKKYNIDGKNIESSYIQIEKTLEDEVRIQQIVNILKDYLGKKKLDAFIFIVHDMSQFKTMYYLITDGNIQTRYYENYTSRGNTIIPEIITRMK